MRKQLVLAMFLALTPAAAATLTLSNSALFGLPDDIVGWGFTIEATPVQDGGGTIVPWLLISGVDYVPDPGIFPVGVFTPFLTVLPELNTVIGGMDDQGNPNPPWIEDFDNGLMTGIGSYQINDFQSPGDQTTGNIVVTYDMFSVSPDDPNFIPEDDTLATGLTMSAPTSVTVTGLTDVPEPRTGILLSIAVAGWLVWRRRRAAAGILMAVSALAAHAAYRIDPDGRDFTTSNPSEQLTVRFHDGRAEFTHPAGRFSLALAGAPPVSRAELRGNRIEFTRGPITEWFVNDAGGLEQGFTIAARPTGARLELWLECGGDFLPTVEGSTVLLRRDGRTILRYAALHSWDAGGRPLPSRVEVVGRRIHLLVDDSAARYPVTVDPIVQQARLLPVAAAASAGQAVAIGRDLAVIAADKAVFVYWRGAKGWSSGIQLRADSTSQAYSVAAGDGIIAVGLPNSRKVMMYTGSGDTWTLSSPVEGDLSKFGISVALSGNTLLVGNSDLNLGSTASIYVQEKSTWNWQQDLGPPIPDPSFGLSMALDGDTALVGAPRYSGAGAAFVYHRVGAVWTPQTCTCLGATGNNPTGEISPPAGAQGFGSSVALDGDTAVIGALQTAGTRTTQSGSAYVYVRSSTIWSTQFQLVPPGNPNNFAAAVAVRGDIAVVTASSGLTPDTAFVFSRIGVGWIVEAQIDENISRFGTTTAMLGGTLLIGSPDESAGYVYQFSNVALTSSPPGRGFTLTGAGCGTAGSYTTPYAGLWSTCSVQWTSPDTSTPGVRYTFQNWSDAGSQNPRTLVLSAATIQTPYAFDADFLTEYQLSTQAVPVTGGTVTGSGWYPSGSTAVAAAIPNPGFLFTGFSGALTGFATPPTLLMNGPKSVTGGFSPTPPAVLAGIISSKFGTAANRQWTISLTDQGPGTAYNAQLFLITFAQTFGTSCTAPPLPLAPVALPLALGTLAPGSTVQAPVQFDFTGCPANARFTVNIGYMSNSGWSGGVIQLVNQVY